MSKKIYIAIDLFDETCLRGWCALNVNSIFKKCPLLIDFGNEFIKIEDFTYREDIKNANIGDGEYAFSVNRDFCHNDNVIFYELETCNKILECKLNNYKSFSMIDFESCHSTQIKNIAPYLSTNIVEAINDKNLNKNINLFLTNINNKNFSIYYFQIYDRTEFLTNLQLKIFGCKIYKNFLCSVRDNSLYEFIILGNDLKNSDKMEVLTNSSKYELNLNICHIEQSIIYLFCTHKYVFYRVNNKIMIEKNKNYVLFNNEVVTENEFRVIPNFINLSDDNLDWSPSFCIINDQNKNECYNIIENAEHNFFYNLKNNIDYKNSLIIYKNEGTKSLISKYYSCILQRAADTRGLEEITKQFDDIVSKQGIYAAINAVWNRFTTSDEFKNTYFHIVKQLDT